MIVVDQLSVGYGGLSVLEKVSLNVGRGEWVGVIGPNGAGKSTLLRSLIGLLPSEGTVRIGGDLLSEMSTRERAQLVAYVPQSPVLPEGIAVADYVLLGRAPYISLLGRETKRDHRAARDALELLNAGHLARRDVSTLSGGEAQRVVLSRAIAQEPKVLLLDEPTSALDLGRQQETMQSIDDLRAERSLTVVATMHDLMLAGQFADRLLLLNSRGILAEGTPREVLTSETISKHYGAKVRILQDPEGGVLVVPVRPGRAAQGQAITSESQREDVAG